jgi:hypothetical protein
VKDYRFLGYLPFTEAFTRAQVEGKTILEYDNHKQIKQLLAKVWEKLRQEIPKMHPG